jgi:hypothetical protein
VRRMSPVVATGSIMTEVLKPELLAPVARAFARRVADYHLQETPSGGDVQMSEEKWSA